MEYERPLRLTTKSAEFYQIFHALGFCLFRNIFGRSTPSEDFYESLRLLQNVTLFFGATYGLSRSVLQKAINISQPFQNGA